MKKMFWVLVLAAVVLGGRYGYQMLMEKNYYEESQDRVIQMLRKLSTGSAQDRQMAMAYWLRGKPLISDDEVRANLGQFDQFVEDGRIDNPDSYDCETVEVVRKASQLLAYIECDVDGDELFLKAPSDAPIAWDED